MKRLYLLPLFLALAPVAHADVVLDFQADKSLAKTVYDEKTGYGFKPGAVVTSSPEGSIVGDKPFYFSVVAPEGNYKVTVTLGDSAGPSNTTIKAEPRILTCE